MVKKPDGFESINGIHGKHAHSAVCATTLSLPSGLGSGFFFFFIPPISSRQLVTDAQAWAICHMLMRSTPSSPMGVSEV